MGLRACRNQLARRTATASESRRTDLQTRSDKDLGREFLEDVDLRAVKIEVRHEVVPGLTRGMGAIC